MSLLLKLRPIVCIQTGTNSLILHSRGISTTCSLHALNSRVRRIGSSVEKERKLKLSDNIPEGYEIIYRAPMENYLAAAQHSSTITATLIGGLGAYKAASDYKFFTVPFEIQFGHLVAHESDIWWFAAGFIAINIAIRYFVAKYPLRIYKSDEKYVAVYNSQIPFLKTQHKFERGSVSEVSNTFNPWRDITFRLGTRTSLLLLDYFKTPSDFHNMCGTK